MDIFPGKYPAIVKQYLADKRTCRVEIPGITDGAEVLPMAEIEYPIGDKSKGQHPTEIEILPGDTVWIEFIGGDPRYPLITGWRNPGVGNSTDWRRFHHANIELTADGVMKLNATRIEMNASEEVAVTSPSVAVSGSSLTHNGTNVGDSHTHSGITPGPASTGAPN